MEIFNCDIIKQMRTVYSGAEEGQRKKDVLLMDEG